MNLQEPKKKKRVKLKPQSLFPIPLNETQEWPVYTAHLTDMGSCIIEPEEMNAVHSMVNTNLLRIILCIKNKYVLSTGFFW